MTSTERSRKFREKQKRESFLRAETIPEIGVTMPHSREIEQAVLGAVLIDNNEAMDKAVFVFNEKNVFYDVINSMIWDACLKLRAAGEQIDRLSVLSQMRVMYENELSDYGFSPYYLVQMSELVCSSQHIETHCRILLKKHICREIIVIGRELQLSASSGQLEECFQKIDEFHFGGISQAKPMEYKENISPTREFCSLFPRFRTTILFAPAKTGKSSLAFSIFDCLSKGESFFFENEISCPFYGIETGESSRKAKVLYIDGEMNEKDYQERGISSSLMLRITSMKNLKAEVMIHKPDYVIIDTISQVVENLLDTRELNSFFQIIDDIKKYTAVVVLAHTQKSEFGKVLGVHSLFGSVAQLNKIENLVSLNFLKGKYYIKQHFSRSKVAIKENKVLILERREAFFFPVKIMDERRILHDVVEYKTLFRLYQTFLNKKWETKHEFCKSVGIRAVADFDNMIKILEELSEIDPDEINNNFLV